MQPLQLACCLAKIRRTSSLWPNSEAKVFEFRVLFVERRDSEPVRLLTFNQWQVHRPTYPTLARKRSLAIKNTPVYIFISKLVYNSPNNLYWKTFYNKQFCIIQTFYSCWVRPSPMDSHRSLTHLLPGSPGNLTGTRSRVCTGKFKWADPKKCQMVNFYFENDRQIL